MRLFNYFFYLALALILIGCGNDYDYYNGLLNIKQIKTIDNIANSISVVDLSYNSNGELEGYSESVNGGTYSKYNYKFSNLSLEVNSDTIYVNDSSKKEVKLIFSIDDINHLLTEVKEVNSLWSREYTEINKFNYVLNYDSSDKLESIICSNGTKYLYTWAGTLLVRIEYLKYKEVVWVGNIRYDESIDNPNTNLDLFREFAINLSIVPKLFEGVPLNMGLKVACLPQALEVTTALGSFNYSFSYDFNKDNNIRALEVCGKDGKALKSVFVGY